MLNVTGGDALFSTGYRRRATTNNDRRFITIIICDVMPVLLVTVWYGDVSLA